MTISLGNLTIEQNDHFTPKDNNALLAGDNEAVRRRAIWLSSHEVNNLSFFIQNVWLSIMSVVLLKGDLKKGYTICCVGFPSTR